MRNCAAELRISAIFPQTAHQNGWQFQFCFQCIRSFLHRFPDFPSESYCNNKSHACPAFGGRAGNDERKEDEMGVRK